MLEVLSRNLRFDSVSVQPKSLQISINIVFLLSGRCLDKQYQIPILVSETGISSKRITELEEEISAILDAKRSEVNQGK